MPSIKPQRIRDRLTSGGQAFRLVVENKVNMSSFSGKTMDEKIADCMKKSGDLVDAGTGNGALKFSDTISFDLPKEYKMDGILYGIDKSEPAQFLFGSPRQAMSIESKSLSDSLCYRDENFYNSYLISEIEAKDANIKVVCERGDVKEIYQVIDKDKVLF